MDSQIPFMDLMNDGSTAYEAGYGGNYNSLGVGGDGDEREDNNDEEKGSKRLPWTEEDNIRLKMDPEGAIANGSIHLQWTEEEDLQLIFAWLNNSIQAIDENLEDLWNQIANDFNENSLHERRRQSIQCKRHWYKLNNRIVLFHSMWRRVRDLYITCRSSDELVSRALDMYRSETNKSFKDLNSWSVLRNEPHWNLINFQ
ncbi:glutathione S-transferase T3-like [Triticum dicoccoides]|uniref:glutathione S-transferase T3-like n=1 Tax=Triticum dicoccoides TaxID=85692 RepID=UPI001890C7D4|nr:glutathione S-transferase T3-like [Triticum dicoccoides]